MKDEDPYVRKTAAICVAKLHDINAQMVVDQGFVEMLTDLLSDANPMVLFFNLKAFLLEKYFFIKYAFYNYYFSILFLGCCKCCCCYNRNK